MGDGAPVAVTREGDAGRLVTGLELEEDAGILGVDQRNAAGGLIGA